jgi:hypothetical protein
MRCRQRHATSSRLHQESFRRRVLRAYRERCTVCQLRHVELLEAAHILPDGHPRGEPIVANGLSLCKLHHAAFDLHILGITPDCVVRIRADILAENDGPMLQHGLKDMEGRKLAVIPGSAELRPRPRSSRSGMSCFGGPAELTPRTPSRSAAVTPPPHITIGTNPSHAPEGGRLLAVMVRAFLLLYTR